MNRAGLREAKRIAYERLGEKVYKISRENKSYSGKN